MARPSRPPVPFRTSSPSASCVAIAPIPPAGSAAGPSENARSTKSRKRLDVGEPLLEEDPAQERGEEALDRRARDARAPEGVGGRRLVAAPAEELQHGRAVTDADDATRKRAQAADRRVARVGEPPEAAIGADDRAPLELPQVEPARESSAARASR